MLGTQGNLEREDILQFCREDWVEEVTQRGRVREAAVSPCLSQHITTTPTTSCCQGLQGATSSTFPAQAHELHLDSSLDKSKHEQLLRKGELHTISQLLLPCLSPGGAGGNVWAGGAFVPHKELSRIMNHRSFPWFVLRRSHTRGLGKLNLCSLSCFYQRLKTVPY